MFKAFDCIDSKSTMEAALEISNEELMCPLSIFNRGGSLCYASLNSVQLKFIFIAKRDIVLLRPQCPKLLVTIF